MNPTNKRAYQRHMYSGPRKSRKKVQATLKRHHGNSSKDFYRAEAWGMKKQKTVEDPADCPVVLSPHTTQDHHQRSNLSTAQDTLKTYSRRKPQIRNEAIACSSSSNTVESVTEQVETIDFDLPQPDLEIEAYLLTESQDSTSVNEIKVFCPNCNTEVSHTAEGIQEDKTKILVAKVYHYFEQEYEELKKMYGDLDLTPLSKFRQRTALATGVSETTLLQILKEEEERNADKRREPPQKRRAARKRRRQTDSSSEEDSSDDNDDEQPSYADDDEPEIFLPTEVKLEPSDGDISRAQLQMDPISVDVKTEPRDDEVDTINETLSLYEPADSKRKGRKIPRKNENTSTRQHTPGESSAPVASSSVPLTGTLLESCPSGEREIKTEQIEIHEEGFS